MSRDRVKIRIAGSGGQGVVLASIALAEAAGIYDGRFVCQTQSYGPEARGGSCKAEVVISIAEIDYPKAKNLDILMALNQESLDDYFHDLKSDGILIINSDMCLQVPISTAYGIPFSSLAANVFRLPQTMNMIALGALTAVTGIVSPNAIKKAAAARAPSGTQEINLKAVNLGIREGKKEAEKNRKKKPEKLSRLLLES